jgi:predicted SAM-dependent methyltransferase
MIAKELHDVVLNAWAYAHKTEGSHRKTGKVKVNVGAGLRVAEGWINVDVNIASMAARWPRPLQRAVYRIVPDSSYIKKELSAEEFMRLLERHDYVHHRIEYGMPFDNNSIDYIFTSHFVEHLYRSHAQRFFEEAYRTLKPGGLLRISVPDLENAVSLHQAGQKDLALRFFYYDAGTSHFTRHRYMYDFELMKGFLLQAGFSDVQRCDCQQGKTPDIEILDNHPGYSLFVEATK